jgi:tetratricopeptide (TPR) repeat protein
MYTAWLKSISAAVCIGSLSASSAFADPASMAMNRQPAAPAASTGTWPWSSSAPPAAGPPMMAAPTVGATADPAWKHPIAFVQSKFSETSFGLKKSSAATTHPVMQAAAPRTDAISLSVPTGPPTPEFFILAAQMCERQNDVPQARQNLQRALAMWPGNSEVLRAAARLEDRQGNLPLAETLYQQAVAGAPQNAVALNDLGLCLAREGKLETSLQVMEQAIQLKPDSSLFRNNAATVLVEMRQDQRALAHLSAVHNSADANYNLGQLLVNRGRANEASPYFAAALQQNPGMQQAADALAKLPGNQVAAAAPASPVLAAPQQQVAPMSPFFVPQQQAVPAGPQLTYPATARTPGVGTSSYVPPQYVPPVAMYPGAPMQR